MWVTVAGVNRLAEETSPYLRQHRDNPVDWYPWGEEAFAAARELDRPILLSVGYSACHWCHVMAHECFEDPETAALMNRLFVNVKVDREERPDVDAVYMEAVVAISGGGGWPMTVLLLPDGRPFFAGTYIPRANLTNLAAQVAQAWATKRADIDRDADELLRAIAQGARMGAGGLGGEPGGSGARRSIDPGLIDLAVNALSKTFDHEWGGFGRAPKFPQPGMLELVLLAWSTTGDPATLHMVTETLDAMASGGIYDHLGGGFARYATDRRWLVPHFEKMLYDNAQLIRLYLHAWQATGEPRYRQVVEETASYLLGPPMHHGPTGFCSAEDADSEGVEGKFYVWGEPELVAIAGQVAAEWYGVTPEGNWEHGNNILWRPVRGDLARGEAIEAARRALLAARGERIRPGLDDKVLTEWNAMTVAALAEAGTAMDRPDWVRAAEETANFLLDNLRRPDGRWLRSWQGGRARHLAYAVDYAWLVEAFTRLGEATGKAEWTRQAADTASDMLELFWDGDGGGLFTTGSDAEKLIIRAKDTYDGATPSSNSVAAVALLRLAALTGQDMLETRAKEIIEAGRPYLERAPAGFATLVAAAEMASGGLVEIVVSGTRPDLTGAVQRRYLPRAVLAWGEPFDSPLWEGRSESGPSGRAFVCRKWACLAPSDSPESLELALAQAGALHQ